MHTLRFKNLSILNTCMGFSKLKMNPPPVKPVPVGFKPNPGFKAPTVDKNINVNSKLNDPSKAMKPSGAEMNIK